MLQGLLVYLVGVSKQKRQAPDNLQEALNEILRSWSIARRIIIADSFVIIPGCGNMVVLDNFVLQKGLFLPVARCGHIGKVFLVFSILPASKSPMMRIKMMV